MRLIDADKLRHEAEHCLETTGAFVDLIDAQPTIDATVRKRPEKFIPCTCGCNRREHHYVYKMSSREESVILKCMKCCFSVEGKNEMDARRKWNEIIREKSTCIILEL